MNEFAAKQEAPGRTPKLVITLIGAGAILGFAGYRIADVVNAPPDNVAAAPTTTAKYVYTGVTATKGVYGSKSEPKTTTVHLKPAVTAGYLEPVSAKKKRAAMQRLEHSQQSPAVVLKRSIGMELIMIPTGEFLMGSDPKGKPSDPRGQPQHRVQITKPFAIGKYEVTRAQFAAFVKETNYQTQAERERNANYGFVGGAGGAFEHNSFFNWRYPGYSQDDDYPVVLVSWLDANEFCKWLGQVDKKTYRLPTEAEWEYASRNGSPTSWWAGQELHKIARIGNVADESYNRRYQQAVFAKTVDDGFPFTAPVGQFEPNPFDLYDMHGNVSEWCNDWGDDKYYQSSPAADPQGPATGTKRIIRGGSWAHLPVAAESAHRDMDLPTNRNAFLGFRVVMEDPPSVIVSK